MKISNSKLKGQQIVLQQLGAALEAAWNIMDSKHMNYLVKFMRNRCQATVFAGETILAIEIDYLEQSEFVS